VVHQAQAVQGSEVCALPDRANQSCEVRGWAAELSALAHKALAFSPRTTMTSRPVTANPMCWHDIYDAEIEKPLRPTTYRADL